MRAASAAHADWRLAYGLAAGVGVVALAALVTAPVAALLGDSRFAVPSALHGLSGFLLLIVSTVAAYLALRLYAGRLRAYEDLQALSLLAAFLALVTVLFGNLVYIYYRAPEGPRAYFLETEPDLHRVFFVFKQFAGLCGFTLAVVGAYGVRQGGPRIVERPAERQVAAALLWLSWGFLVIAFGLGAAITRIRGV